VLRVAEILGFPMLLVARAASALAGRRDRLRGADARVHDGLEDLLRDGELEGIGKREEIEIITGVVHFAEKRVRDVMTPRAEVFAIDESAPPGEAVRRIAQSAYSRVPVYRKTLDDVVGIIHVFDILDEGPDRLPPLHPVLFADAGERCDDLLVRMLQLHQLLAVVRDEAGRTLGIATLEDLLEELVGEIRDEHDEPHPVRAA
jgi:putative hemolysin